MLISNLFFFSYFKRAGRFPSVIERIFAENMFPQM